MKAKGRAKGGGQIADISLPPPPLPLLVTGDQASGTWINQTSPATASFRLISLVQLYRDMAIRTKGQRETKKEMRDGALNEAVRRPKAICSCVPPDSERLLSAFPWTVSHSRDTVTSPRINTLVVSNTVSFCISDLFITVTLTSTGINYWETLTGLFVRSSFIMHLPVMLSQTLFCWALPWILTNTQRTSKCVQQWPSYHIPSSFRLLVMPQFGLLHSIKSIFLWLKPTYSQVHQARKC